MSNAILVTGFGPFGEHNINASWEAVKLLPETIDDFNVVKQEVPVTYDHVETNLPSLWKKLNPTLVIHVGVSSMTRKLTLEKRAHKKGYVRPDCLGKNHPTGNACSAGDDCILTEIDVDDISNNLNNYANVKTCVSDDAGRYLCEFLYYTSLEIDRAKTLFIHVPPLDKPYSSKELSNGLLEIIKCALHQIRNKDVPEALAMC